MSKTERSRTLGECCPICGRICPSDIYFCPRCGTSIDHYPDTDTEGRRGRCVEDTTHCPRCGKKYWENSNYCSNCGEKRTEAPGRYFKPSPDEIQVLYGPMPVMAVFTCRRCGHKWSCLNRDPQHYCPSCGKRLSALKTNPLSRLVREIMGRR